MGRNIFKRHGYELYAEVVMESNKMIKKVYLYMRNEKTKEEVPVGSYTRKDILNHRGFDVLLDYEIMIEKDELKSIASEIKDCYNGKADRVAGGRVIWNEVYRQLSECIRDKAELLENDSIFVKGGKGYVRTTEFKRIIRGLEESGYSRKEILENLAAHGLLDIGKNRVYDKTVSRKNRKNRYYVITLKENQDSEEEDVETIEFRTADEERLDNVLRESYAGTEETDSNAMAAHEEVDKEAAGNEARSIRCNHNTIQQIWRQVQDA